MAFKKLLAGALFVALCSSQAMAWSKAGHMVVGAVAYDDLKANHPATLAKVLNALRQHPQWTTFEKRLQAIDPANRDRYLFMIASRWPDDIRDDKSLSHPSWHYIDYPLTRPGEAVAVQQPDAENAITALTKNVGVLKDPSASPGDKAVAVCWMEHLIGDVHQPMHAVSLFTDKLPKGDRGGNDIFVMADRTKGTINLHALWDSMVTGTEGYQDAANIATELRNRPAFSRKALPELKNMDPNAWVKESVDAAYHFAYLDGRIESGTRKAGALLPPDYLKNAKPVAEKRTVLAGYRLADAMVALFGQ